MESLENRIAAMDWKKPYVWRLKVSSSEFEALESAVRSGETDARHNVVYLAEWYRRRYDGGTAKPIREFDCKALFTDAGIDSANLFETEGGLKSWQYSIYVLGGLAMRFESGKRDSSFLKEICRLYYGEEGDIDRLGTQDQSRAIAFRESVRTKGCLYDYLRAILEGMRSGNLPFSDEDMKEPDSEVRSFLERLKNANDAVLKSKYELEWIFGFNPAWEFVTRRLRLVLKPESLGGLNHSYLGYGRVNMWGIIPETCRRIVVGVRFLLRGAIVVDPDFEHPLLDYANTGNQNAGFVAWGTERTSRKFDAPGCPFDAVEVVAIGDNGTPHVVETFSVAAWMQVFRLPDGYNEWTTRQNAQRASALICPDTFEMLDVGPTEAVFRKRLWSRKGGTGAACQWRFITDVVRFKDESGKEIALYNRQGYDQVVTRLHTDVLRYHNGYVDYVVEEDGELVESWLPLIFAKDDLIVRHFTTRNDLSEIGTEGACEKVEFLKCGTYHLWTETEVPIQGRTTLRLTIKGTTRKLDVYVFPGMIRRDGVRGEIRCGDEVIVDRVERTGLPTDPVVHKSVGEDDAFVSLEIWRATHHKELIRNGRVIQYVEDGETADISYVLREGLSIHDFSASGYREYACDELKGIYSIDGFTGKNALSTPKRVQVCQVLDGLAPEWLWVNLAMNIPVAMGMQLFHWDYLVDTEPQPAGENTVCTGNDIIFQSLASFGGSCVLMPRQGVSTPFSYARIRSKVDLVKCFEVATVHRVYFSAMLPFRQPNLDLKALLFDPLLAKRVGILTDEDRKGLRRLAEEFGFEWREKYGIEI